VFFIPRAVFVKKVIIPPKGSSKKPINPLIKPINPFLKPYSLHPFYGAVKSPITPRKIPSKSVFTPK